MPGPQTVKLGRTDTSGVEGGSTPPKAAVFPSSSAQVRSARRLGWAAFDAPEVRRASAAKARVAVVVFCLHVVLFQLLLAFVFPSESGSYFAPPTFGVGPGTIFFGLALLYLFLAVLIGLDSLAGEITGYALCGASLFLWVLMLVAGPPFSTIPTLASWILLFLSIMEAIAIVIGLLIVRDLVHEPRAQPTL